MNPDLFIHVMGDCTQWDKKLVQIGVSFVSATANGKNETDLLIREIIWLFFLIMVIQVCRMNKNASFVIAVVPVCPTCQHQTSPRPMSQDSPREHTNFS